MILEPTGGLCNRLRAILSRLEPGLVVYWSRNWEICNALWHDVFQPLPGVTFVYTRPDHVDLTTYEPAHWNGWHHRMLDVRPWPSIQEQITGWASKLGTYNAMHIRRTDVTWLARDDGSLQSDESFRHFVNASKAEGTPVFLATDNGETQSKFYDCVVQGCYGGAEECGRGDHSRHSSLAEAVIDFYTCVGAKSFMGTRASSFSVMVEQLREVRRCL
jgi:hypothetical protein